MTILGARPVRGASRHKGGHNDLTDPAEATVASSGQAEAVAHLPSCFNAEFASPARAAAELAARFRSLLARDGVLVLLAGDPAAPTGSAFLTLPTPYCDGPLAQLEELYVQPGLRGRGIGTVLLTAAPIQVRKRGAAGMPINADEVDRGARRFDERHGFSNIEPGKDYRMLCCLRGL